MGGMASGIGSFSRVVVVSRSEPSLSFNYVPTRTIQQRHSARLAILAIDVQNLSKVLESGIWIRDRVPILLTSFDLDVQLCELYAVQSLSSGLGPYFPLEGPFRPTYQILRCLSTVLRPAKINQNSYLFPEHKILCQIIQPV
jgi:hypothetical protein